MTTRRDPDAIVDAFLAEGPTDLPDRVFDAVRGDIHKVRQRRTMGRFALPSLVHPSTALAAVIVLAIGLVSIDLFSRLGSGQVAPTPRPTSTGPERDIPGAGRLAPGRYVLRPSGTNGPSIVVDIRTGDWRALRGDWIEVTEGDPIRPAPAISVQVVSATYADPCTTTDVLSPTPGPGVSELITALAAEPGVFPERRSPVVVSGFRGEEVHLRVTAEACLEGFRPWAGATFVMEPGDRVRLVVLDVVGERLTYFAFLPVSAPDYENALVDDPLASVEVRP